MRQPPRPRVIPSGARNLLLAPPRPIVAPMFPSPNRGRLKSSMSNVKLQAASRRRYVQPLARCRLQFWSVLITNIKRDVCAARRHPSTQRMCDPPTDQGRP
jgi:hypothetical protein